MLKTFRHKVLMNSKRGFILILTLWVLIILSVIALSFARRVQLRTKITKYHLYSVEAKSYAIAMLHLLCSELMEDTNDYDAYSEAWGREHSLWDEELLLNADGKPHQAQDVEVKGWVVDEQGKINLNTAELSVIRAVLSFEDFEFGDPDSVAEDIVNWRKGLTRGFYIPEKGFSGMKGRPFSSFNEILWVPEITVENMYNEDANANSRLDANEDDSEKSYPYDNCDGVLQRGLIDYFTIYSNGKININTAPKAVLLALPRMNETKAEELIRRRAGLDGIEGTEDDHPFQRVEDIMELDSVSSVPGFEFNYMLPWITVKSNTFTLIAESYSRRVNLTKRITAVMQRDGKSLKCTSWKEE